MASEFKPNEAGLDQFQKDIEALFAEINTRVRARLGKKIKTLRATTTP